MQIRRIRRPAGLPTLIAAALLAAGAGLLAAAQPAGALASLSDGPELEPSPICWQLEPVVDPGPTPTADPLDPAVGDLQFAIAAALKANAFVCKEEISDVTNKDPKDGKVVITIGVNKKLDPFGDCSIEKIEVVTPKGIKPGKGNTVEIPYDPKAATTEAEITFTVRCLNPIPGGEDFVYKRVSKVTITPDPKGDKVKIETTIDLPK